MDNKLEEKVMSSLKDGHLPCAVALNIAPKLKTSPRQVGDMANKLKIRIISCQLGFFKFEKATHDDLAGKQINKTLAEEIKTSLVNDYLPCAVAFKVASKFKVVPKEVGDTATKLNIRIASCQLGCFP